jgi:hypothetical protein
MRVMIGFAKQPRPQRHAILLGLLLCSAVFTLAAVRQALVFDATAGESGFAPAHWPAASRIERSSQRPVLILFAHPQCSCTNATLEELGVALSGAPEVRPAIRILFSGAGYDGPRQPSGLWTRAAALPGAVVSWDEGREAQLFGARTSGTVLLYDRNGSLLFEGGITGSRGHVGSNYGLLRLNRALRTGEILSEPEIKKQPFLIFGCSLFGGRQ